MNVHEYIQNLGQQAKAAAQELTQADSASKDAALHAIADKLLASKAHIRAENQKDLIAGKEKGLDAALLDRLELTEARIEAMAEGLRQVAALPDPVGQINDMVYRPSGIQVGKMRVPIGVIAIIYESRPNVTADAAALCLKSGNAAILRGGSEALNSNLAIAQCIREGLQVAGLNEQIIQIVNTADRAAVGHLITLSDYVDVIVPRGGKSLIERISQEATIAVIKHLDGICHVYIDVDADLDKAKAIAINAKTHRYGVCNAMETLLVHEKIAADVLPDLVHELQQIGVEIRACDKTRAVLKGADFKDLDVESAVEEDWASEYLAAILSIKLVASLDDAVAHIAQYGSDHTDAIVTQNVSTANQFVRRVNSSSVMVNASTRFADGFEYGFGAEIGISTDKLHARGPVGLIGLTSEKYVVIGDGHIRS